MKAFAKNLSPKDPPRKAVPNYPKVQLVAVGEGSEGQRLDNFLTKVLKGVPKSHIYRLIRSGEVRVSGKRAQADTRLEASDQVRVPPVRVSTGAPKSTAAPIKEGEVPVLYEDRDLLILNKPAGLAAHSGSGISFGLIERLLTSHPQGSFLELAHRLDRDTSGVIAVCKTRKALVRLQEQSREGKIAKHYRLLVKGDWVNDREHVKLPLTKFLLPSGERRVRVDEENGQAAHTIFTLVRRFGPVSYLDAELKTGRTHQIRVHAASRGFPLVGDVKYGDYAFNREVEKGSLGVAFKRMFLHACKLSFTHPITGKPLTITAPLPADCTELLAALAAKFGTKGAEKPTTEED